jgi:hypothetical protein
MSEAASATLQAFEVFAKEGTLARDSLALLRGLGWALSRRRVVPPRVLAMRERVRVAEQALDAFKTSASANADVETAAARAASNADPQT